MADGYPAETYQFINSTWWSNVVTLVYVPWGADLEHPTITSEHVSLGPMPAGGQVVGVQFYCTGAAGSTILGFHKNNNTTATVTDTVVVSASTLAEFDWGSAATFAKNDRVHVSIDPAAAELVGFLSLKVRFNW